MKDDGWDFFPAVVPADCYDPMTTNVGDNFIASGFLVKMTLAVRHGPDIPPGEIWRT